MDDNIFNPNQAYTQIDKVISLKGSISCSGCVCYSHHFVGGDLDPSAGSYQRDPEGLGSWYLCEEQSLSWFCVGRRGGGRGKLCWCSSTLDKGRGFLRAVMSVSHSAFCSASTQAAFICSLTLTYLINILTALD